MKEFIGILRLLTTTSLNDITKKLGIKPDKDSSIPNNEYRILLIQTIKDWFDSKKKWYDKRVFKILISIIPSLLVGSFFFYLKNQTDISNKSLKLELDNTQSKLYQANLKIQNNRKLNSEILTGVKKMEDQSFKKYDLIKAFFPNGYFVSTYLPNNEKYTIRYPGKWNIDPENITLKTINNKLWLNASLNSLILPENIKFNGVGLEFPLNEKIVFKLQIIPIINHTELELALVLLNQDLLNPVFAIGITTKEIIKQQ